MGHGAGRGGNSRSSHHPLGLGSVATQVGACRQPVDNVGLDRVGEAEVREMIVCGDGRVVDAAEGEDEGGEDACAFSGAGKVSGCVALFLRGENGRGGGREAGEWREMGS